MHKFWLVAVFCLMACACAGETPVLRSSYQMDAGLHRYPVTLNFDKGSGQYWGQYINKYYGTFHLGNKHGQPTIYFDTIHATRLNRPERMLQPEQAYFDFLYGNKTYTLTGDELVIKNYHGDYIRFKAVD